jgi:ATP-dependent DNA helicase RecG
MNLLETPIEYLKGVGPQRGDLLRKELSIHKYIDLLNLFPNRYIDRTRYYKINELQNTTAEVQIIGKIIHIKTVKFGKNQKLLIASFYFICFLHAIFCCVSRWIGNSLSY